jgi:hypothetical protein
MEGKLWDRADLLAALAGIEAAGAATEVTTGASDQLVRAAAAQEQVVRGSATQIVSG